MSEKIYIFRFLFMLLFMLASFITMVLTLHIVEKAYKNYKGKNNLILFALGDFIRGLFMGKNWFGIILSLVDFVILIPAFLLLVSLQVIIWLMLLGKSIWDLGNKKIG